VPNIPKAVVERAILDRFLSAYEKQSGISLSDVVPREKPDYETKNPTSGELIGTQATGVYQTEDEAKIQCWVLDQRESLTGAIDDPIDSLIRSFAGLCVANCGCGAKCRSGL
jgi:hypothetical protein